MTKRGHLIVVEGPDGVGKSTITNALVLQLHKLGLSCHAYAFPGNEPKTLGSLIYQLHHKPSSLGVDEIAPVALQASHIAAHLDAIERFFLPKINSGENCILDRFWWSTAVYGKSSNISPRVLEKLIAAERLCWGEVQPLVIFLIDCHRPWREEEDTPTWHNLAQEYRDMVDHERSHSRIEVVNNHGDLKDVVSGMVDTVIGEINTKAHSFTPAKKTFTYNKLPPPFNEKKCSNSKSPIFSIRRFNGLKPTKVFDTYWRFATERQNIFFRRLEESPPPWSSDTILQRHRFTNAYRASDRVSQYLINKVQYSIEQKPEELFFRTILFKLFNRIDTWELLERNFGKLTVTSFNPRQYEKVLDEAKRLNKRIYSAAYIMPSVPGGKGQLKHIGHLRLLEKMLSDDLPQKLADAPSLHHGFNLLKSYPTIGYFLAFQFIIDLNYSQLLDFSEMDFVVPGPGAKRGIQKCFTALNGINEEDVIRYVTDNQYNEFTRRNLDFRDLWGRPLQLIDIQNLFCEIDKYSRIAHPEMNKKNGRTRIKQIFHPSGSLPIPWYPPKWNLNKRIRDNLDSIKRDADVLN